MYTLLDLTATIIKSVVRLCNHSCPWNLPTRTNVSENSQIAKAMITTGKVLSANTSSVSFSNEPNSGTKVFKVKQNFFLVYVHWSYFADDNFLFKLQFGELQVAVTPQKAYTGAAIAFIYGYLWKLVNYFQELCITLLTTLKTAHVGFKQDTFMANQSGDPKHTRELIAVCKWQCIAYRKGWWIKHYIYSYSLILIILWK